MHLNHLLKQNKKAIGSEFTTYLCVLIKTFYPSYQKIYMDNICASMTNSMSVKKSTACCLRLSRQVGWISRLEIVIYLSIDLKSVAYSMSGVDIGAAYVNGWHR